jgi:transposase-like protein
MLEPLVPRALVGKTVPMPDPEARERPLRRTFTAAYKLRIVEEANAASEPGAVGALLRREGLYSSHLVEWRRLYRAGALSGLTRPRGRPAPNPLAAENDRRRAAIDRLEARLARAEKVIAVQGNVSALLRELSLRSADPKDGR